MLLEVLPRAPTMLLALLLLLALGAPAWPPPPRDGVLHLLRRATFGPTPALVDEVEGRGTDAWLREQLSPPDRGEGALRPLLGSLPCFGRTMLGLYQEIYRISPPEDPARPEGRRNLQLPPLARMLARQRLVRAVHSEHQLREVLTDFWFNHFYVDVGKSEATAFGVASYEDDLRRHALGRFRDLLEVSARSPAMLDYLDNASSSGTRPGGLNENFGRELLELHTVGVDAGYTQQDVEEVSRCFTGWGFRDDRGAGDEGLRARRLWSFRFAEEDHSPGPKRVLGVEIPASGEQEGERVLDLLARHPATAVFVCRKLAVRLIGETVSEETVHEAARVFRESEGDIARVVGFLLTCPEFGEPRHRRARYKTPLEFAASALRVQPPHPAIARDLGDPHWPEYQPAGPGGPPVRVPDLEERFLSTFTALGTPYGCQAPTGWPDRNATWLSTSDLHYRVQLAQLLVAPGSPGDALDRVLLGEASPSTHLALREASLRGPEAESVEALTSPEFLYR